MAGEGLNADGMGVRLPWFTAQESREGRGAVYSMGGGAWQLKGGCSTCWCGAQEGLYCIPKTFMYSVYIPINMYVCTILVLVFDLYVYASQYLYMYVCIIWCLVGKDLVRDS